MKRSRLFRRVLLAVVALFVCSATLSALLSAWSLARVLDNQYRSKAMALASNIASASVDDILLERDIATLQAMVDQYAEIEGVAYILVRSASGEILVHTFVPEVPAEVLEAASDTTDNARRVRVGDHSYLEMRVPILEGELGQVQVGMNLALIHGAFWRAVARQAVAGGGIGVTAILLAYSLVRRITRPLGQLTRLARKVAALESLFAPTEPVLKELGVVAVRTDEVGELARSLSVMIEAIGAREQQLKWAETRLRRSEQYFRSLIENVGDVILLVNGDGVMRYVSPSVSQLLNFRCEEWIDHEVSRWVHTEDREAFARALSSCSPLPEDELKTPGEGASVEIRMLRSDGTVRLVDVSMTNLIMDPAVAGVVLTIRDITDRQRTRELNRAKEAAEEASRLKTQILCNISHEFLTPMHHLLGLSRMTLDGTLDDDQRENVELMHRASVNLLTILEQVLDFSALESGRLRLAEDPVDMRLLIVEGTGLLEPRAQNKGLRLITEIGDLVPQVLIGDATRLRQVLLILLDNAIKFTTRGGICITLTVQASGDESQPFSSCLVKVTVRDSGIGIPRDKQQTIFAPFVQADGSLTRQEGGLGLGLAVARSLVELMGGTIWLESEPGEGSKFHFTARLREGI